MLKKWMFTVMLGGMSLMASAQVGPASSPQTMQRAFKVDPFSPMTSKLTLGYEQRINEKLNMDVDLGIIGVDMLNLNEINARGLFIKFGPRFYSNPDYYTYDMLRYSDFQGFYLMPALGYTFYRHDGERDGQEGVDAGTINAPTLSLNIGRQMVFGGMVTLDINGGLGYGFADNYDFMRHYSNIGNRFIASFSLGLGLLTK